jgi:uncharacterized protein GlcG (DUF336 family)
MHRMDGQDYLNIVTAEMKARTALMLRAPSKTRMNQVIQNPDSELQQIQIGLFPNSGGLPIFVGDQMIGAIGVGGSAPRVAQGWRVLSNKASGASLGRLDAKVRNLRPRLRPSKSRMIAIAVADDSTNSNVGVPLERD